MESANIDPQNREILRTFVCWGHELFLTIQTSVKFRDFTELYHSVFQQITFTPGTFTYLRVFFPGVDKTHSFQTFRNIPEHEKIIN